MSLAFTQTICNGSKDILARYIIPDVTPQVTFLISASVKDRNYLGAVHNSVVAGEC